MLVLLRHCGLVNEMHSGSGPFMYMCHTERICSGVSVSKSGIVWFNRTLEILQIWTVPRSWEGLLPKFAPVYPTVIRHVILHDVWFLPVLLTGGQQLPYHIDYYYHHPVITSHAISIVSNYSFKYRSGKIWSATANLFTTSPSCVKNNILYVNCLSWKQSFYIY